MQEEMRILAAILLIVSAVCAKVEARSYEQQAQRDSMSAVIPSPNEDFAEQDIVRKAYSSLQEQSKRGATGEVPVYVSPFARSDREQVNFERQESSHAPPNYAPRPQASMNSHSAKDLKTSASYGHHHGGQHHYGYDHSGWLDMGAWTGGKGSFGWYADYPVGGGKHHGYGRK